MKKHIVTFHLLLLLLASCQTGGADVFTPTATPPPTISPTTVTQAITTITPTAPTEVADPMQYQCLEIADRPPPNYVEKGVTIFNLSNNLDAFLWDNDVKRVYRFPREEGDRLSQFEVSPDRKHVKYIHSSAKTKERRLVIAAANGQPIWSQPIDISSLWGWFDSTRLMGFERIEDETPSLFLLNPFTGEHQDLQVDFPGSVMFPRDTFPRWRFTGGGFPIYSPTLTRVIFPECDEDCSARFNSGNIGWPLVLWNLDEQQVVTRIMTLDGYGETPLWKPDGSEFILATKIDPSEPYPPANEFFAVSSEGDVRQLTQFMSYYDEIYISDNYSLSPDGRLLAFWIVAKPSTYDEAHLAVLNTETDEVINYCIKGDPFMNDAVGQESLMSPLWSPDGTQLLVVSRNPQNIGTRRVILVDLVQNYAAQIAEDVEPVGWMVNP